MSVTDYELGATKKSKREEHPTYTLVTGVSVFSARKEVIEEILEREYGIKF